MIFWFLIRFHSCLCSLLGSTLFIKKLTNKSSWINSFKDILICKQNDFSSIIYILYCMRDYHVTYTIHWLYFFYRLTFLDIIAPVRKWHLALSIKWFWCLNDNMTIWTNNVCYYTRLSSNGCKVGLNLGNMKIGEINTSSKTL